MIQVLKSKEWLFVCVSPTEMIEEHHLKIIEVFPTLKDGAIGGCAVSLTCKYRNSCQPGFKGKFLLKQIYWMIKMDHRND